jgi:hypothetical protein
MKVDLYLREPEKLRWSLLEVAAGISCCGREVNETKYKICLLRKGEEICHVDIDFPISIPCYILTLSAEKYDRITILGLSGKHPSILNISRTGRMALT